MFKNSVLKPSVDTIAWMKATAVRTVKTMAQTALGSIGAAAMISGVDWRFVLSASLLAGVTCILTCIAGIPEVESEDE